MGMDPVTSAAFEGLVAEILPALQKRLSEIASKPGSERVCDEDTRHLVISTIDMLASLRVWLAGGVPGTSTNGAAWPQLSQFSQIQASPVSDRQTYQTVVMDDAALERLGVAITAIELDHFKLLGATKDLLGDPSFANSPALRKFADLTAGIVKSFGNLRSSVDAVQRRTGDDLVSATLKLLTSSYDKISADFFFEQISIDQPMLEPVAAILADLIRGVNAQSVIHGRVSAGMIRIVIALDGGDFLPLAFTHTPWFKAAVDAARRIKGVITLDNAGAGSINFEVPVSLRGIKGIVVRTGGEHYALPDYGIVETIRIDQGKVQTIDGQEFLNIQESSLPLLSLPALLGKPGAPPAVGRYALVVESRGQRCGLVVDELVQHRDLTLRPLGGALAARPEIFGGAIDADGKIIVVFDPREIGSPQQGG
jgi:hypothetical protein